LLDVSWADEPKRVLLGVSTHKPNLHRLIGEPQAARAGLTLSIVAADMTIVIVARMIVLPSEGKRRSTEPGVPYKATTVESSRRM
jgi:hypothetical protein